MRLLCFAICGPGLVRTDNQDNLYINGFYREDISDNSVIRHINAADNRGLYAVADGMGGEMHGELAALEAVRSMGGIDLSDGQVSMSKHIETSNGVICEMIMDSGARIGATFVGLCITSTRADIINIGDSRLYLLRGGELRQLSRDHTPVRQMLDIGVITEEAARKHPDRHKLTQHMGIFPAEMIIEPHNACIDVEDGDAFLLCSDGLTDMLEDGEIKEILETDGSLRSKAESLYEKAIGNGGKDNITVLIVEVMQ